MPGRLVQRASRIRARAPGGEAPPPRAPPALRGPRVDRDRGAEASPRELIEDVGGAIGVDMDESDDQLAIG
jgi:hypothetical protein